jgi:hypothetical protein
MTKKQINDDAREAQGISASRGGAPMKRFTMRFSGRRIGSIGTMRTFVASHVAENRDDAALMLYDKFEHITSVVITSVDDLDSMEPTP